MKFRFCVQLPSHTFSTRISREVLLNTFLYLYREQSAAKRSGTTGQPAPCSLTVLNKGGRLSATLSVVYINLYEFILSQSVVFDYCVASALHFRDGETEMFSAEVWVCAGGALLFLMITCLFQSKWCFICMQHSTSPEPEHGNMVTTATQYRGTAVVVYGISLVCSNLRCHFFHGSVIKPSLKIKNLEVSSFISDVSKTWSSDNVGCSHKSRFVFSHTHKFRLMMQCRGKAADHKKYVLLEHVVFLSLFHQKVKLISIFTQGIGTWLSDYVIPRNDHIMKSSKTLFLMRPLRSAKPHKHRF